MLVFLSGLLPALLLILYIYKADKLKPEPPRQLWRAFLFGVASVAVSLFFSVILGAVGLDREGLSGVFGAFNQAFFGAAISEECAKLLMLWLVVRKNPYFDERMDGIVYAVCVGMGFAGFENIMYLDGAGNDWIGVGIVRALLAVPGHFYDAVFMGYFFGLYWFEQENRSRNLLLTFLAPIAAHGLYDFLLMWMSEEESLAIILFPALIYLCVKCFKWSKQRIVLHIESDGRDADGYNRSER